MTAAPKVLQAGEARLWLGIDLYAWMRFLVRNRFAIGPAYWPMAALISACSVPNTVMKVLTDALFGGPVARRPMRQAPLFIVGHWRTGTTLLHELLICDPQHTYATFCQCLFPHHFLLTDRIYPRLFRTLMPRQRPMDAMEVGWDRPQEDELALALLGAPSPYVTMAFPNHPPQDQDALDVEDLPTRYRLQWKRIFSRFVRELTFRDPRRLILKSPTHSFRIKTLLELYPDARFVHIVRDPYAVFPSTVNLWKKMYTHGLQTPRFNGLEEHVFQTFVRLYAKLEEGKRLIPPHRFHEMHYEELIRDPEGQIRLLYERLQLDRIEEALPPMRQYLARHADYQTNHYPALTPESRAEITQRWGPIIERYGYSKDQAAFKQNGEAKRRATTCQIS